MNIKLFVCCHQKVAIPENSLLQPIQAGAALATEYIDGFFYDDSGLNISDKNRSYCELTAQYWVWKNYLSDYYGFFHYRRYLYPDISAKIPYRVARDSNFEVLDKLGFDNFLKLIPQYDLISPLPENIHLSVRKHYAQAKFQHIEDIQLVEQIVRERHPEMISALEEYFGGTCCYFGNIYIMKRNVFFDYCNWLFPILSEFDYRANISNYSLQEKRVDGYLAERLFGVYYTYIKSQLKTLELPRLHFLNDKDYRKQIFLNYVLPPGSIRRAVVKKLMVK